MNIRAKINERLGEVDVTVNTLARYLGWERPNLSKFLNGHHEMRSDRLGDLLDALDLEIVLKQQQKSGVYAAAARAKKKGFGQRPWAQGKGVQKAKKKR
jgi:plasmid maintenance system antidote protein VapI